MRRLDWLFVAVLLVGSGMVAWGLDGPPKPPLPGSEMYSLEAIYNRLHTGATGALRDYADPSMGPVSGVGRTLNEVIELEGFVPGLGWDEEQGMFEGQAAERGHYPLRLRGSMAIGSVSRSKSILRNRACSSFAPGCNCYNIHKAGKVENYAIILDCVHGCNGSHGRCQNVISVEISGPA